MLRLTIKQLAAKRLRLLTTTMAVLLGVAFLAGTLVLTDTLGHTLDGVVADANVGTDAYVRANTALDVAFGEGRPSIDASVVDEVRRAEGVAQVAPRITGYAQLLDKEGEPVGNPQTAPALGLNWVTVDDLNPYQISSGQAPAIDAEIVIDQHAADRAGYAPGDTATVLSSGAPRQFTIAGIATFGGADSAGGVTAVLFTEAVAQDLLGEPGRIDGVAVTAEPGISQERLVAAIKLITGDSVDVIAGEALTAEDQAAVADNLAFFNMFMLIFALVAVFVGAFIINNTFSITVAQRTREMAMLRAIGADRRQILGAVLIEAVAIAVIASVAGLALGVAVATGLELLLGSFGFDLPEGPTVVSARTVVVAIAVGVVVTVASAFLPARRAARIAPIAAMRETSTERQRISRGRIASGLGLTTAGVVALLTGLAAPDVSLVGVGAVMVFLGVSVLGPAVARPFTRVAGALLPRLRGMSGTLARENAMRNPKRTARTAASLMIGVGLVGFITVFAASTKTSIAGALERDFRGTHIIESGASDSTSGISPDLARSLHDQPGISAMSEARVARADVDGEARDRFYAFHPQAIGELFDLGDVRGDLAAMGADGLAVFTDEATERGWDLGDTVKVRYVTGPTTMVVRAIFDNGEEWVGREFVGVAAFDAAMANQLDSRIYLATTDVGAVERATGPYPSAEVLDEEGFVAETNAEIDTLLGLIYVMLALAVVIALLGIANTLALSIFERAREFGLLRAVGMSMGQLRSAVRWEAALIALFGATLGLAIGVFFGWTMVRALASEGITELSVPLGPLALITAIAVVSGVVAAVLPARRAARLNVLKSIATG